MLADQFVRRLPIGAPVRGTLALGAGLRQAGLDGPPRLRLELARSPRGRALLYLALSASHGIELPGDDLYGLFRDLNWRDFLVVGRHSAWPGAAPGLLTDAPGGSIDYDYFAPADPAVFDAPYPLHPYFYRSGLHARLPSLRRGRRPIGLLFAGTHSPTAYGPIPFPMPSRPEIVGELLRRFRDRTLVVTSDADLMIARSGRYPIVVVATDRTDDRIDKYLLTPERYIGLVRRSRFALCPPGVVMPHAHNLPEALAVGTVPVLPYPGYCRPPLEDGVNCLAFADLDGLGRAVEATLAMPGAEAGRMSAAAARYYDDHCSVAGFARRLRAADPGGRSLRLRVNDEHHSVELHAGRLVSEAAPGAGRGDGP